jgi:hypothetical protein
MDISTLPDELIRYISQYVYARQPRGFDTARRQIMAERIRRFDAVFSRRRARDYEHWQSRKFVKHVCVVGEVEHDSVVGEVTYDPDDRYERYEREIYPPPHFECWFACQGDTYLVATGVLHVDHYDSSSEENEAYSYTDERYRGWQCYKLDLATNTWQRFKNRGHNAVQLGINFYDLHYTPETTEKHSKRIRLQ